MFTNKICLVFGGLLFLNLSSGQASITEEQTEIVAAGLSSLNLSSGQASVADEHDETEIVMDFANSRVRITKGSIQLNSISDEDLKDFQTIWGNAETMKWIGKGNVKSPEESIKQVNSFKHCWIKSFESRTFFYNMLFGIKVEAKFAGYINLFTPHDEKWIINNEGRTELSIGILPEFQRKGQGKQATEMIVYDYIPFLNENNFLVGNKPILSVEATCKLDNTYVNAALKKACGEPVVLENTSYGSARNFYKLPMTFKDSTL